MNTDQLCKMSGDQICVWLTQNLDKMENENLLLLAESASINAFRDESGEKKDTVDVKWLEAGVLLYEHIQSVTGNDFSYHEMNLRASIAIETESIGQKSEQVDVIKRWFNKSKNISVSDAIVRIDKVQSDWAKMDYGDIVLLNGIKSKLVIFERLFEAGFSHDLGLDLLGWLDIKQRLP